MSFTSATGRVGNRPDRKQISLTYSLPNPARLRWLCRATNTGIELESGKYLEADLVISATGFEIAIYGQLELSVDGKAIDSSDLLAYKGLMFSGLPNFAWCTGYINASWTLRADLSSQYVCKFLNHLDKSGYAFGIPNPGSASAQTRPLIDLSSGYLQRVADVMPRQGVTSPWTIRQNWLLDSRDMKNTDLDQEMVWTAAKVPVTA